MSVADGVDRRPRGRRQRWALPGSRYDRAIAVARTVLPVSVGVLAAFLVLAPLSTGGDVSFVLDKHKVEVAHERLKLQAAEYRGQDTHGQPFVLKAGSAVQKSSAEPIVQIHQLAAAIRLPDGLAHVNADTGRYDMDRQQVAIAGPVQVFGPQGYLLRTRDATLSLQTKQMSSNEPVSGTVPQGNFSGDRFHADLANRTVTLDGHAHLQIAPGRAK